ncbi:hypothetical protein [Acinetobacter bereziniae]|uniref:hypothetical protein n=1 Tax=Acinetobacter bereziniae TaxID=106648 RepID=UPI00148EC6D9|nr:hypothetical protein [Acinetobacter bereziniae]
MFWRNPNHLEHAELYFDKILELYDESQVTINEFVNIDRETIEDLHKNNKDKNVKKIIQYLFLPMLTFEIVNSKSPILCAEIEDDFFITCDKPIIFQGALEKLFLFENFYWPIDSRRLIVSKDFFEQNLSIEDINLSSALNAKKYILGAIVNILNIYHRAYLFGKRVSNFTFDDINPNFFLNNWRFLYGRY